MNEERREQQHSGTDPDPVSLFFLLLGAAGSIASIANVGAMLGERRTSEQMSHADDGLQIDAERLRQNCFSVNNCIYEMEMILRTSEGVDIGFEQAELRFGHFKPKMSWEIFRRYQNTCERAAEICTDSNEIIYGILTRAAQHRVLISKESLTKLYGIHEGLNNVFRSDILLWRALTNLRRLSWQIQSILSEIANARDR